jgi:hypothetical protein
MPSTEFCPGKITRAAVDASCCVLSPISGVDAGSDRRIGWRSILARGRVDGMRALKARIPRYRDVALIIRTLSVKWRVVDAFSYLPVTRADGLYVNTIHKPPLNMRRS